MKIYTEVNYEWKNDSLVQTSSESFDYSGDIALCGGGGGGNPITKVVKKVHKTLDDTVDVVKNPAAAIEGGPGGTLGQMTDKVYGGSFKNLVEGAQGKDPNAEGVAAPVLSALEVDAEAALTAQNKKREELAGRGAANLTAGQSATMLTA